MLTSKIKPKNSKKMKKILIIVLSICLMNTKNFAQSKDEKAVVEAVETLTKIMIDPDKVVFEKIASDALTYGHSGGKVENKTEFIDAFVSGKSDFVKIDITDQTIAITGDVAIVRHKLVANTNDKNVPATVKLFVLLVWQKEKGNWKLLARQAVKNLTEK
jgi:ketosteroid isomerase-like protein